MDWKQTTIFDVIRDTQRAAWNDIQDKLGAKQKQVFDLLTEGPATGYEIARQLGWHSYRTLPRITELTKSGLIEDSGFRRVNPESGKMVIVWRVKNDLQEAA
jgi:predicted ArsR family transcriptional regulator